MQRILLAILFGGLSALPVRATEPEAILRPASPWNVHYSESQCELRRKFTDGRKETLFVLETGVSINSGKIVLVVDKPSKRRNSSKASLNFGNSKEKEYAAKSFPSNSKDRTIWNIYGVDTKIFDAVKKTTAFSIAFENGEKIVFDMEGISDAFVAQKTCQNGLLEHYGVDLSSMANLLTIPTPLGDVGRWVRADDYPSGALQRTRQGEVVFQLTVDELGKVDDCKILSSSGHSELDERVCTVMQSRAKFQPALDNKGQAVAGPWFSTVEFSIPN